MLDGLLDWLRGPRPDVVVDFRCDHGALYVELVNLGTAPAHDVSATFRPSITCLGGRRPLGDQALFRRTGFLAPGRRIVSLVDSAHAFFRRTEPTVVDVEVTFRDGRGRRAVNRIRHDLEIYRDLPAAP